MHSVWAGGVKEARVPRDAVSTLASHMHIVWPAVRRVTTLNSPDPQHHRALLQNMQVSAFLEALGRSFSYI